MKKFIVLVVIALFGFTKSNAQEPSPVIEFSTKEVNFGVIAKNSDPIRKFTILNAGKVPLVVKSCSGSCGCTVPTCPQEPIMPGKSAIVNVRYDTSRPGPFSKLVTVYSNDVNNAVATIVIKGEVNESLPTAKP
jgi:hypothetical protein